jgi:hypothetical protein
MANRLDDVRVAFWLATNGNYDHFANPARPILSGHITNPTDEPIVIPPGTTYLPGLFHSGAEEVNGGFVTLTFPIKSKAPAFSGGVKTK